ncbi:PREDICTED: LOB domain-containing protein 2 [Tarenaya hassleriana]|uniref:LOB domain-containing protein 2 n=1 Tax=Tarenaya hassleriana TaxID=28532 RepID=UPI00053C58D9|nr:PREDICTED: LOB domain-containing protein 2 [Tarenaya hassleriana]XP_019056628.1 PREDICTED: LOB domain-containing protein 2 [Tarenaya hassleriana]XP_019056629.1 PREDICTED: LOB domain-containing protein 2 [Tarenaya hassleriana]
MMQRDCETGNNTSTHHQACASCKHQRKKCNSDCVLAPYFPSYKTKEFQAVHRVFGVSNVQKMVRTVREEDRTKLSDSLTWEALWRQKDPVLGLYGEYRRIHEELKLYKGFIHHHQQHLVNWDNISIGNHHVFSGNNNNSSKTGLVVDYASGSGGFGLNNGNNGVISDHNGAGVNRVENNGGYSSRNLLGGWDKFKQQQQQQQQCYAVVNDFKQRYPLSHKF